MKEVNIYSRKRHVIKNIRIYVAEFTLYFILKIGCSQIDSNTIDGNVEFVHSQYSCILSSQVSIEFLSPTKLSINSDNFRVKYFSYSKISAILCVL